MLNFLHNLSKLVQRGRLGANIPEKQFLPSNVDKLGPLFTSVAVVEESIGSALARMIEERVNCLRRNFTERDYLLRVACQHLPLEKIAIKEVMTRKPKRKYPSRP